jgi:hypothetical protein
LHEGRRDGVRCFLRDCQADYNLYYCAADPEWGKRHLDAQQKFGIEGHSVSEDPLLTEIASGDLRLKPNSPALKLGFEPIDLNNVGLIKER